MSVEIIEVNPNLKSFIATIAGLRFYVFTVDRTTVLRHDHATQRIIIVHETQLEPDWPPEAVLKQLCLEALVLEARL